MKIGLIGNGIHSKRIQRILKKKKINFFLYKPTRPIYYDKKEYAKLKKCNIIFIITPNNSHFNYIKKLHLGRYIFCEKPPVNSRNALIKLKKINSKKIYFNYNTRFSKISEILKKRNKYRLGNLMHANLTLSHGLAKKKEYKKNWRSNIKKCPKGVFEIVSIHLIDLINFHFNIDKIKKPTLINQSGVGNSYDSSSLEIILKNKAVINVFSTYNSPYSIRYFFLFENGIVEQFDNNLMVKGPAMNLDKQGFLKKPKVIESFNVNDNNDYIFSLEKSVNYFLNIALNKKAFKKNIFDCSIKSNSLIL